MGGELPVIPTVVTEPTVAEWQQILNAYADPANVNAVVSLVLYRTVNNPDGTTTSVPVAPDIRIPKAWVSVSPRFAVTPPVVDPPVVTPPPVNPTPMTMYVVSPTGVSVRVLFGTDQLKIGTLPFGSAVEVETVYNATATGYVWRKIYSGPYKGDYVAEKSSDGATKILSATPPK